MPYKDQNLDYLYSIQKDFSAYKGAVVAFNGEVAGVRETAQNMRIILRIDTPLYYYATGKGNNLSYEMIYVRFTKDVPRPTAIIQGHKLKVLGRVDGYEKRQDTYTGKTLGVVRLDAIALADRTTGKDFIRQDAPSNALYQSWKAGKLFFEESAESVLRAFPPAPTPEPKPKAVKPVKKTPKKETPKPAVIPPSAGIVFDEEEPPFILPPDPQTPEEFQAPNAAEPTAPSQATEEQAAEQSAAQADNEQAAGKTAPAPESQPGNAALMNNPAEEKETEEKTTPSTSANEQAGKATLNKTTGEQTAEQTAPGKANKEQTEEKAALNKAAGEQTAEQTAPGKANKEQTGENSALNKATGEQTEKQAAPKADKEKAEQAGLNKADEKQTEEPTAPGKATGEQAAEQADLNKADKKQPEEKAVNPAAQNVAAEGHHPQGAATQAQAAEETPLRAPAAPQTGAQSTQETEPHAAPEKATPAPENTRF